MSRDEPQRETVRLRVTKLVCPACKGTGRPQERLVTELTPAEHVLLTDLFRASREIWKPLAEANHLVELGLARWQHTLWVDILHITDEGEALIEDIGVKEVYDV